MAKKRVSPRQVQMSVKRAENARLAARLKREGKLYCEIAKEIGVSISQVSRLIIEQKEVWQQSAQQDTTAWITEAICELRQVAEEAWKEWERSKQNREIVEVSRGKDGTTRKKRREGQTGNQAFLKTIADCIRAEGELRGVYRTDINFNQQVAVISGSEATALAESSMAASMLPPSLVYSQYRELIDQRAVENTESDDDSTSTPTDDDGQQDA